jgi:hypothetical protein
VVGPGAAAGAPGPVEIVDGRSGEVRTAQVFVATMGASS